MPLKLVRSDSNSRLWGECVSRFLGELDGHRGPDGFLSHLWLSHRTQRDALLEETASRDLPGWLAPPFSFFSELAEDTELLASTGPDPRLRVPLGLRSAVNRVVEHRWHVVRSDQRGVLALDDLLREWHDLVPDSEREIELSEWYARLRRLLESNEIAISSPSQRGVQVLEAHEAALTPFRHAFVIHANEGVFPPRTGGGVAPGSLRYPAARGSRRSSKPPGAAVRGTVGGRGTAAGVPLDH